MPRRGPLWRPSGPLLGVPQLSPPGDCGRNPCRGRSLAPPPGNLSQMERDYEGDRVMGTTCPAHVTWARVGQRELCLRMRRARGPLFQGVGEQGQAASLGTGPNPKAEPDPRTHVALVETNKDPSPPSTLTPPQPPELGLELRTVLAPSPVLRTRGRPQQISRSKGRSAAGIPGLRRHPGRSWERTSVLEHSHDRTSSGRG